MQVLLNSDKDDLQTRNLNESSTAIKNSSKCLKDAVCSIKKSTVSSASENLMVKSYPSCSAFSHVGYGWQQARVFVFHAVIGYSFQRMLISYSIAFDHEAGVPTHVGMWDYWVS